MLYNISMLPGKGTEIPIFRVNPPFNPGYLEVPKRRTICKEKHFYWSINIFIRPFIHLANIIQWPCQILTHAKETNINKTRLSLHIEEWIFSKDWWGSSRSESFLVFISDTLQNNHGKAQVRFQSKEDCICFSLPSSAHPSLRTQCPHLLVTP